MIRDVKHEKCSRKIFGTVEDSIEMPNLIKVQKDSYEWFIEEGLGEVLKDISPIVDYTGTLVLEFFDYYMEDTTKYSIEEAKERDATYATRLHVKVRLINKETGEIKVFSYLVVVDEIKVATPKTKEMVNMLNSLELMNKKVLIVVNELEENLILASRNLLNIALIEANELNVLDLSYADVVLTTKEGLKSIEEVLK